MREAIRQGDIPGVQLRRRQALALPPAEAWRWVSEPSALARWLADSARGEAKEGASLTLTTAVAGAKRVEQLRFVSWEAPHRWVAAFEQLGEGWASATRLEVEVFSRSGGAEISVLQDGFHNLALSRGLTVWEDYRRRWRTALERLATLANPTPSAPEESTPPRP